MKTTTYTVADAPALAEQLNRQQAAGQPMTVNGHRVHCPFRAYAPFRAYRTGSISVWVRGNGANNTRMVWFRAGQSVTVVA
jgi:hypothetical protein